LPDDDKNTQVRYSKALRTKILDFKKVTRERYMAGAIRQFVKKGLKVPPALGPYHLSAEFQTIDPSVRQVVQVEQIVFAQVDEYRADRDLTYERAFLEFILRGLESYSGAPVTGY